MRARARACFVRFTVARKSKAGATRIRSLYISWKQHYLGQKIGKEMLTNYTQETNNSSTWQVIKITPRDRLSAEFSVSDTAYLSPFSDVGRRTECIPYLSRRVYPLSVQTIKAFHMAIV